MSLLYAIDNFITDDVDIYSSSEDTLYVLENLYNIRPSLPFRFTGQGSVGNPEWICFDFGSALQVTLVALFNTNLTSLAGGNDELTFKGCDEGCPGQSGACDWDNPDYELDLSGRQISNFKNLYSKLVQSYQYFRLDVIDALNPHNVEYGELFIGQWQAFSANVHLQPGRDDGPQFFMEKTTTHYGQDWTTYYSEKEKLSLTFKNINDPSVRDELHTFLKTVQSQGGKFILIPEDSEPFCFYVTIENLDNYASRLMYGKGQKELREWSIDLVTLTEGITLL